MLHQGFKSFTDAVQTHQDVALCESHVAGNGIGLLLLVIVEFEQLAVGLRQLGDGLLHALQLLLAFGRIAVEGRRVGLVQVVER